MEIRLCTRVCVFCLCTGFEIGTSLVQGVLRFVYKIRRLRSLVLNYNRPGALIRKGWWGRRKFPVTICFTKSAPYGSIAWSGNLL